MKVTIQEKKRGILYKNGKFSAYLKPGKYRKIGGDYRLEIIDMSEEIGLQGYDLSVLRQVREFVAEISIMDVPDQHIALHYTDGRFTEVLSSGEFAYYNQYEKHTFRLVDIRSPEVAEDIPAYLFQHMSTFFFYKIEVAAYEKARLYFDGKFVRLLEPGVHYFWKNSMKVTAETVDTRWIQAELLGQEMLTLDKVAVRINFTYTYKITDYIKIKTEIDQYEKQMHTHLQLALRDYVSRYRLDEILEDKQKLSAEMMTHLKEKEADLYVQFSEAGVKDMILPGEIRSIMNTVLIAEKKAQANVITRREEVASTRSLLNTAKLMDENQTLYKLKELEYLEKICDNVGNITVNGGSDLLGQLTQILKGTS